MDIKKELQDLCDRYKAEAEKILERAKTEKKPWKPEDEEPYYFAIGNGHVLKEYYKPAALDNARYSLGNCFPTKEAAEFAVEKLKVIAELKRFAEEHNEEIDWKNIKQKKHCITYCHLKGEFEIDVWNTWTTGGIYFSSEEIAKAAIEAIGEERLKKYYFEVE